MPKAVYRKYETAAEAHWEQRRNLVDSSYNFNVDQNAYGACGFLGSTGKFSLSDYYRVRDHVKDYKTFYYDTSAYTPGTVTEHVPKTSTIISGYLECTKWKLSSEQVTIYSRGNYLADATLDFGSVPENGHAPDGYWYEFVRMVGMYCGIAGTGREATGWAQSDGVWKEQSEILANVDGIWKG